MSAIILNEQNFETEVLKSDIPVFVDFFATWCGPCKMLSPIISNLAEEYKGRVKICKIDVDEQSAIAAKFGIQSIPTMKLFKNGEVVETIIGFRSKDAIVSVLEK